MIHPIHVNRLSETYLYQVDHSETGTHVSDVYLDLRSTTWGSDWDLDARLEYLICLD